MGYNILYKEFLGTWISSGKMPSRKFQPREIRWCAYWFLAAYGTMAHVAAAAIAESGIDAELIDLRSVVPLDIDAIVCSVSKTGRCIVVYEVLRFGGLGGELSALIQERCFYRLESPVLRVCGWDALSVCI